MKETVRALHHPTEDVETIYVGEQEEDDDLAALDSLMDLLDKSPEPWLPSPSNRMTGRPVPQEVRERRGRLAALPDHSEKGRREVGRASHCIPLSHAAALLGPGRCWRIVMMA